MSSGDTDAEPAVVTPVVVVVGEKEKGASGGSDASGDASPPSSSSEVEDAATSARPRAPPQLPSKSQRDLVRQQELAQDGGGDGGGGAATIGGEEAAAAKVKTAETGGAERTEEDSGNGGDATGDAGGVAADAVDGAADVGSAGDNDPATAAAAAVEEEPVSTGAQCDHAGASAEGVDSETRRWTGFPQHAVHAVQGTRPSMEDAHVLTEIRQPAKSAAGEERQIAHVYAVFDGHGGAQVAEVCAERVASNLARAEGFWPTVEGRAAATALASPDCAQLGEGHIAALKEDAAAADAVVLKAMGEAFAALDRECVQRATEANWIAGSTGVVAVLTAEHRLYVANIGDSEGHLGQRLRHSEILERKSANAAAAADDAAAKPPAPATAAAQARAEAAAEAAQAIAEAPWKAREVTHPHKPSQDDEKARIKAAGAHIIKNRINGALAVSRAFGDKDFKAPLNGKDEDFVSHEPHVAAFAISPKHEFLVLACDGLWDVFEHDAVAAIVGSMRSRGKTPAEVTEYLTSKALEKGSMDNISVLVVFFPEDPSRSAPTDKGAGAGGKAIMAQGRKIKSAFGKLRRHR